MRSYVNTRAYCVVSEVLHNICIILCILNYYKCVIQILSYILCVWYMAENLNVLCPYICTPVFVPNFSQYINIIEKFSSDNSMFQHTMMQIFEFSLKLALVAI